MEILSLFGEVLPLSTEQDNNMFRKLPNKQEVKESVTSANMNAVSDNDGLTSFVYKHCWDILSFPEFVPEDISDGLGLQNQQTFKFFGSKPQKKNFLS